MTLKQLQAELDRARTHAESLSAALEHEDDAETLLELETGLQAATRVVARLELRLEQQRQRETDAAEDATHAEQDKQLDRLRAQHAEVTGVCTDIAMEFASALETATGDLWEQRAALYRLCGEHRNLFLKRHGRWPDEQEALRGFAWMLPSVSTERPEVATLVQHVAMLSGVMREHGLSLDVALVRMAAPRPIETRSAEFQPRPKKVAKDRVRKRPIATP